MNTHGGNEFDARLRQVHSRAVEQLSTRTRARLAVRRGVSTSQPRHSSRAPAWGLAAAFAAGALAIGLTLRMPTPSTPAAPSAGNASDATMAAESATNELDEAYAVFDESPELYLWLDTEDARLAME